MTKTKRHMQPTKNMKTTNAAKRTLEVEHENYIKRREGHFARINYETAKQKLIILEENN